MMQSWHPHVTRHLSFSQRHLFNMCKREPNPARNADCMRMYSDRLSSKEFILRWKNSFSPLIRDTLEKLDLYLLKISMHVVSFVVKLKGFKRQQKILTHHYRSHTVSSRASLVRTTSLGENTFRSFAYSLRKF